MSSDHVSGTHEVDAQQPSRATPVSNAMSSSPWSASSEPAPSDSRIDQTPRGNIRLPTWSLLLRLFGGIGAYSSQTRPAPRMGGYPHQFSQQQKVSVSEFSPMIWANG
jgi:hypothetical protein